MDSRTAIELATHQTGRRPSLQERGVMPAAKGRGADWENATSQFPSVKLGVEDWVQFFTRRPDVITAILGDIFREVKAQEQRENGSAPTGRRPKAVNGSLAELESMITPRYADVPFAESLPELIGDRSLRAFAARVPMNHHTLTRMMRGELKLEMWRLELIAAAGRVQPSYFLEWRVAYVQECIEIAMFKAPHLATRVTKAIQSAKGQQ